MQIDIAMIILRRMPRYCQIFGVIILSMSKSAALAQWSSVFEANDEDYSSVSFWDQSSGCVVGLSSWGGVIRCTSDAGKTWNVNYSSTEILAVDLFSESWGVAVGLFGSILVTFDGGQNWNEVYSGTSSALYEVECLGEGIAVVVGCCQPGPSVMLRTSDYGQSWVCDVNNGGTVIGFKDRYNGILANAWDLFQSEDGGATWLGLNSFPDGFRFDELQYSRSGNALLICRAIDSLTNRPYWTALLSLNNGISWDQVYIDSLASIGAGHMHSRDVLFLGTGPHRNQQTGLNYFHILKSIDRGKNWSIQVQKFPGNCINSIDCIGDVCYAVSSNNGRILKTENQGGAPFSVRDTTHELSVFPNPARDFVSISYGDIFPWNYAEISIFSSMGSCLFSKDLTLPVTIDLDKFASGAYFLRIETSIIAPTIVPLFIQR